MTHHHRIIKLHKVLCLLLPFVAASCFGGEKEPNGLVDPPFDPNAGGFIVDNVASKQAYEYQDTYSGNNHAVYVSNKAIDALQTAAGSTCVGLRMYRSVNTEGKIGLILVGVDEKGNDLVDQTNTPPSSIKRVIASYEKCPDNCDEQASVLDKHPNKP